jgi:hypothetical protein
MNNNKICDTKEYKKFEFQFNNNIEFLQNFSNLISFSGRIISFISPEKVHIVPTTYMLDSSIKSLLSIRNCCSTGSFSDANTIIRKLRDDLLLYVYILSIINKRKTFTEDSLEKFKMDNIEESISGFKGLEFNELNHDEKAVKAWLSNKVHELPYHIKKKLGYENYMKVLKQNKNVNEILLKYDLKKYWGFLQIKLNDYVHNNGILFSQHNLIKSNDSNLKIYLQNINTRTSYTITFFLILITMIESPLLCSGDIEDYLSLDIEPPDNCQYEIAPFIQEYINKKVIILHPELKDYLQNNNSHGMIIE